MSKPSPKAVAAAAAPAAIGPYSQGVVAGAYLFISGQLPLDPETGDPVAGGIEKKTRQVLKNIQAIAEAAGAGLDRVVKTTIFLTDLDDFSAVNETYSRFFTGLLPARSTVQVAALPKGMPLEMEAVVYLPD